MRPISLEISAFGPYAERVHIPMDKLGEKGLYLITGDTGAGKTTIFDAITFALYGEASGNNRESGMLRSKYASPETPTEVCLIFLHAGKEYTIKRNPEYERPAKKGDGVTVQKQEAELTYPDGRVVAKTKDVNQAVKDILGIDRDQFSQIAMIAQGDFLKLLLADTKERQAIFRNLFKTGYYQILQDRLKSESGKLSLEFDQHKASIKQYINGIMCDDESLLKLEVEKAKSDQLMITDIIDLLDALLKEDEERAKRAGEQLDTLEKELENINAQLNLSTEQQNRKRAIQVAKEAYEKKEQELQNFATVFATAKENQAAAEQLIEARIEATKEELLTLENAGEQKERLLRLKAEAENHKNELLQIKEQLKVYTDLEVKYVNAQKNYVTQMEKSQALQETYQTLQKAFLDAQAGVLASTLEEGKPCPVCGSTSHPMPCNEVKDAPTKEAVEMAKERAGQAQAYAVELSNQAFNIKGSLDAQRKAIAERSAQLFSDIKTECAGVAIEHEVTTIEREDAALLELANYTTQCLADVDATLQEIQREILAEDNRLLRKRTLQKQLKTQEEALVTEKENGVKKLDELETKHALGQNELGQLEGRCKELQHQIEADEEVDAAEVTAQKNLVLEKRNQRMLVQKNIHARVINNKTTLQNITGKAESCSALETKLSWVRALSNTANGNLTGKEKVMLETYIQMTFFDRILERANTRLMIMTGGQYELKRQLKASNNRSQSGLELDVLDHYNGTTRSVKTLSGGESFKASLSLALGLSDEIQASAGGIRLDTMFVDEGFGSLDEESLQQAIKALAGLAEGNRLVGIISHVEELKNKIDKQLVVKKERTGGSFVDIITI